MIKKLRTTKKEENTAELNKSLENELQKQKDD